MESCPALDDTGPSHAMTPLWYISAVSLFETRVADSQPTCRHSSGWNEGGCGAKQNINCVLFSLPLQPPICDGYWPELAGR